MSDFDYTLTAKRVTEREVAAARLAPDYAALVAHFDLTAETESKRITEVAQTIVLDGAHASTTKVGQALTLDDLKGRDPGDVKTRDYWKAARAVRIGLVTAMGPKESQDVDWIKLVRQAVENAHNHDITEDAIVAAVKEALATEGAEGGE